MSGSDRVAVITGANRGIGREAARQLAGRGYLAVVGARDLASGQRAAKELSDEGLRAEAAQLDVTDQGSIDRLAADLARSHGHVDVLVNNAAIHYDTWQRASNADLRIVAEALENEFAWRLADDAGPPAAPEGPSCQLTDPPAGSSETASRSRGEPRHGTTHPRSWA